MWNSLDLHCPVEDVCEYNIKDAVILDDLPHLVNDLTRSAETLTEDNNVWSEIKVFQNVQVKYKKILHCDKCLHLLQKVGTCIRKVVMLNLSKVYLDLAEQLLVSLQNQKPPLLLPSRQQLEFVLIRTQSAAKLLCEALRYSRDTFRFLIQRLHLGHIILNLMMATSVTARINILFRGILIQLFDIYGKLYSWLGRLKVGTWEWPSAPNLPEDLQEWLNPEAAELLNPDPATPEQLNVINKVFKTADTSVAENGNASSAAPPKQDEECTIVQETVTVGDDSDTGEVLPRTETKIENNPQLTKSQKVLLQKIQNAKSLKKLKVIWNNIDVTSGRVLPQSLVPSDIRHIDHLFNQQRLKIKQVNQSNVSDKQKQDDIASIVATTSTKLAKQLGLVKEKSQGSKTQSGDQAKSKVKLKPAKTMKQFRALYDTLYQRLQKSQNYEKCERLRKLFKCKRMEIKQKVQKGDREVAKKLMLIASELLLTKFKK